MIRRLLPLLVLALLSFAGAVSAQSIPAPPTIDAKSWIIVDYDSGEVLASMNPDERVEPASITKVLTTYIAFDEMAQGRLKPDDEALISEKAWRQGIDSSQSRMFIEVGDHVKVMDLLRGIIIASGNDASVALSEHIAGSEDAFAELMNQYAQRLGMVSSHFADASGMPDPNHYTTARDLSTLARALIHDFPDGYAIYKEQEFRYGIDKPQPNRNLLLKKDPSVDGIKTGHTEAAGYCLLGSAERDGRRLITAVMGAPSWAARENSTMALLNYGFRFWETAKLYGPNDPVTTVRVWKGETYDLPVGTAEPIAVTLPRGAKERVTVNPQLAASPVAPVAVGDPVGVVSVELDGKVLATQPLVALQEIPAGGFFKRIADQVRMWLQ